MASTDLKSSGVSLKDVISNTVTFDMIYQEKNKLTKIECSGIQVTNGVILTACHVYYDDSFLMIDNLRINNKETDAENWQFIKNKIYMQDMKDQDDVALLINQDIYFENKNIPIKKDTDYTDCKLFFVSWYNEFNLIELTLYKENTIDNMFVCSSEKEFIDGYSGGPLICENKDGTYSLAGILNSSSILSKDEQKGEKKYLSVFSSVEKNIDFLGKYMTECKI